MILRVHIRSLGTHLILIHKLNPRIPRLILGSSLHLRELVSSLGAHSLVPRERFLNKPWDQRRCLKSSGGFYLNLKKPYDSSIGFEIPQQALRSEEASHKVSNFSDASQFQNFNHKNLNNSGGIQVVLKKPWDSLTSPEIRGGLSHGLLKLKLLSSKILITKNLKNSDGIYLVLNKPWDSLISPEIRRGHLKGLKFWIIQKTSPWHTH